MTRRWPAAALLVALTVGCAPARRARDDTPAPPPAVAFVGVTVISMAEGGAPLVDRTVVVDRGRIVAIGPTSDQRVPAAALRIDATGKYLMPGLADMHVHLEYFDEPTVLAAFLANGITTIRNMDGRPYILEWKKRTESGDLLGPTIYTAGPLLDGDPPLRPDNTVVRNPAEARALVAAQAEAGYDFIKVYTNLSADTYRAILATAREQKMAVTGHVPRRVTLEDVLASGQTAIEHLSDYDDSVEADTSPFKGRFHWSKLYLGMTLDTRKATAIAEKQARAGVWVVPTVVQADRAVAPAEIVRSWLSEPEMQYIPPDGRAFWQEQLERSTSRMDEEDWTLVTRGRENRLSMVRTLHAAGVRMLAGTDTPNPFLVPGFSLAHELQNFVAAGLTPAEALATATREAARFVGDLDRSGTIEVGKRADLLLLEANPLDSVANVRRLTGVMVRGRWLTRDQLVQMLGPLR